ncbi:hypothetical protein NTE_01045 [Candidatus Nitrososphaera evergladensis SR1]|jgi:hypothetical protein|uniref:Uncharacterized protein n=1 Tax=Candidatus Nitrososphaera evergladensis SR1 TaxID=1459636 RepID=A0A075MPH8_9ARCH|nr:hypothetical protein [Candidatus Nitrososphaera evergladensis]AIF83118.1 hypothetical protein NTE_01045 [Candidatus Nitrososphaera evergladensis SR1]
MNARMIAAIFIIAGLVAVVYVFSIVPYLFGSSGKPSSALPVIQIIIPALAFPLIAVLVFLVPKRQVVTQAVSEHKTRDEAEYRYRIRSLWSGTAAGFFAAAILVSLIIGGDALLGLPLGTFYSIIGIAMGGLDVPVAIFFGTVLHLIMGTLIGAVFGYITTVVGPFNITSMAKGTGVGILAGFIAFSVLFVPLTRFEVEPSLVKVLASIYPPGTSAEVLQNKAIDVMSSVLAGSILLHVVYGAIMGSTTALLLGFPASETKREDYRADDAHNNHHNLTKT